MPYFLEDRNLDFIELFFPKKKQGDVLEENTVFLARDKTSGKKLIGRVVSREDFSESSLEHIFAEEKIQNAFKKRILLPYQVLQKKDKYILLFYFYGTPLLEYTNLSIEQKIEIFKQAAELLSIVHQNHLLYSSLNPFDFWIEMHKSTPHLKILYYPREKEKITPHRDEDFNLFLYSYVAPEQTGFVDQKGDARSDLYSLGVIFYQFFTGTLPFVENNSSRLIYRHLSTLPASPSSLCPSLDNFINQVILKLLSKNPDDRYQTSYALFKELEAYLQQKNNVTPGFWDTPFSFDNKIVIENKNQQKLNELLHFKPENYPSFFYILGESGTGKTFLVSQVLKTLSPQDFFIFYYDYSLESRNIPYAFLNKAIAYFFENWYKKEDWQYFEPFQEKIAILSSVFSFIENFIPPLSIAKKEFSREEFFHSVLVLLQIFSQQKPCVFVLDNIQWMDKDIAELLFFLSQKLTKERIVFILLSRKEEENKTLAKNLSLSRFWHFWELGPLSKKLSEKWIKMCLMPGITLPQDFFHKIYQITNGNPMALHEVLNYMNHNHYFKYNGFGFELDQEKWSHFSLSSDFSDIIQKRLEIFDKQEKEILSLASVMGIEIDNELFFKVLEKNNIRKEDAVLVIEKMKKHGILNQNARKIVFVHNKIRETVYQIIPEEQKKQLHLLCAEILENDFHSKKKIFTIAFHYNQTEEKEKQFIYNQKCFVESNKRFSLNEALFYAQKMFHYLWEQKSKQNFEKMVEIGLEAVKLSQSVGRLQESLEILEKLEKICLEKQSFKELILIYLSYGSSYYLLNQMKRAIYYYAKALSFANEKNLPFISGFAYRRIGSAYWFTGDFKQAEIYLTLALEKIPAEDSENIIPVYGLRAWAYVMMYDIPKTFEDVAKIESLLPQVKNPLTLSQAYHVCAICYAWGNKDAQKAMEYSLLSYKIAEQINYKLFQYSSLFSRYLAYFKQKKYDEALKALEEGCDFFSKSDISVGKHLFGAYRARIFIFLRHIDKAIDYAEEMLTIEKDIEEKHALFIVYETLCMAYWSRGEKEKVLDFGKKAYTFYRENYLVTEGLPFLVFWSFFLGQIGMEKEAKQIKEEILSFSMPYHQELVREGEEILKLIQDIQEKESQTNRNVTLKEKIHLESMIATSQMISSILDLDELLDAILNKIIETTGAERGILFLFHPEKEEPWEFLALKNMQKQQFVFGRALEKLVQEQRGIILESKEYRISSAILAPLSYKNQLLGALYLDSLLIKNLFQEKDLKFLQVFTTQASIAILNAEKTAKIKKQFYDSLEMIRLLISNSSSRIYENSQETEKISLLLAESLNLSSEIKEALKIAALFHDLGMIGDVEKIVNTGKKITENEKRILELHPVKSANIIRHIENMEETVRIIEEHHERYDGSGYPHHKTGDAIHIGAQILGLADDFVELLRKREFQVENKKEKIIQELESRKNKKYNALLVDKLIEKIQTTDLVYVLKESDIVVLEENDYYTSWQIPSNLHFEALLVSRAMEKITSWITLDPELEFAIEYSLSELVRNAIIHGNKYNAQKKVTLCVETNEQFSSLKVCVRDQGEGMDVKEHNRFSRSRADLLAIMDKVKQYQEYRKIEKDEMFDDIMESLKQFKSFYYTDYNTFRQLEGFDLTGGVGLLYVQKTFDKVEISNIIVEGKIVGAQVLAEKTFT